MGYLTQQEQFIDRLEHGIDDLSPIDKSHNEPQEEKKGDEKEEEGANVKRTRREKPAMTTQPFLSPPYLLPEP